jgi:hypothetical protein
MAQAYTAAQALERALPQRADFCGSTCENENELEFIPRAKKCKIVFKFSCAFVCGEEERME